MADSATSLVLTRFGWISPGMLLPGDVVQGALDVHGVPRFADGIFVDVRFREGCNMLRLHYSDGTSSVVEDTHVLSVHTHEAGMHAPAEDYDVFAFELQRHSTPLYVYAAPGPPTCPVHPSFSQVYTLGERREVLRGALSRSRRTGRTKWTFATHDGIAAAAVMHSVRSIGGYAAVLPGHFRVDFTEKAVREYMLGAALTVSGLFELHDAYEAGTVAVPFLEELRAISGDDAPQGHMYAIELVSRATVHSPCKQIVRTEEVAGTGTVYDLRLDGASAYITDQWTLSRAVEGN